MIRRLLVLAAALAVSSVACSSGTQTAADGSGNGSGAAFAALGRRGAEATIAVTYQVTAEGEAAQDAPPFGEATIAQDPPRRSFQFRTPSAQRLVLFIVEAEGSVVWCGGEEGDEPEACVRFTGETARVIATTGGFLGPIFIGFEALREITDEVPGYASTGAATIAGRAATCGRWTPPGGGGVIEQCLDDETGFPLSWRFEDHAAGKLLLEASDVRDPTEEDLTPTGEVLDANA